MIPCRRFALPLAEHDARLGGDVTRYVFIVEDLHLLLLAGLPAHYQAPVSHRRPHRAPPRLRGQPAQAQADRGGVRLDEDRGWDAQDTSSRHRAGRLDVHPDRGCLQPAADAEAAGCRGVTRPGLCPKRPRRRNLRRQGQGNPQKPTPVACQISQRGLKILPTSAIFRSLLEDQRQTGPIWLPAGYLRPEAGSRVQILAHTANVGQSARLQPSTQRFTVAERPIWWLSCLHDGKNGRSSGESWPI